MAAGRSRKIDNRDLLARHCQGWQPNTEARRRFAPAQLAESNQLGNCAIDQHRLFVGNPIVGAFSIKRKGPCILGGVGHKRLEERAADFFAAALTGI
jgi:hypothetical protein